jgi:hypothetical protein
MMEPAVAKFGVVILPVRRYYCLSFAAASASRFSTAYLRQGCLMSTTGCLGNFFFLTLGFS